MVEYAVSTIELESFIHGFMGATKQTKLWSTENEKTKAKPE